MLDAKPNRASMIDFGDHTDEMTAPETLSVLLRNLPLILGAATALGALIFVISSLQTTQYDANGRLELATQVDFYDIDGRRFAADNFLELPETISALNTFAAGAGTEILNIRVDLPPDSKGIDVNVSATTADGAAAVANELMRLAVANDKAIKAAEIAADSTVLQVLNEKLAGEIEVLNADFDAIAELERIATDAERPSLQSERELVLRERNAKANQLNQNEQKINEFELEVDYSRANLGIAWQAVAPTGSSRPKPLRNGGLGLILGAMIGSALTMVFFRDQARLRSDDRIGTHLGAPVLGELSNASNPKELLSTSIAIDRRAAGRRVGTLSIGDANFGQAPAKSLNALLAQRLDEPSRSHWIQVPPGTPGAPWVVSCGSLDDASSVEYLELVDVVVLFTERNKLSVRKARAAADRLRAMGIGVLGVVVGA
ncbi:MAG: hypothetical protein V3V01_03670 [Acidimicrobiales bacterium]